MTEGWIRGGGGKDGFGVRKGWVGAGGMDLGRSDGWVGRGAAGRVWGGVDGHGAGMARRPWGRGAGGHHGHPGAGLRGAVPAPGQGPPGRGALGSGPAAGAAGGAGAGGHARRGAGAAAGADPRHEGAAAGAAAVRHGASRRHTRAPEPRRPEEGTRAQGNATRHLGAPAPRATLGCPPWVSHALPCALGPPPPCGDSSSEAAARGLWHRAGRGSRRGAVARAPPARAPAHGQPVAAPCPAGGDVPPPRVPSPQGEGRPVAEDGGHRCSGTQPGAPRGRAVHPLPQGFPPPVPALQLQVGSRGHPGTPGDTRGHQGTWGRGARVARPSPHPHLLAGCARARCATRAPWTWASRGGAACSATSRGTRRLREPRGGLSRSPPGHGACGQVLAPQAVGLRCSPYGRPVERERNPLLPSQRLRCRLSVVSPGGVGIGKVARGCPSPPHGDCP